MGSTGEFPSGDIAVRTYEVAWTDKYTKRSWKDVFDGLPKCKSELDHAIELFVDGVLTVWFYQEGRVSREYQMTEFIASRISTESDARGKWEHVFDEYVCFRNRSGRSWEPSTKIVKVWRYSRKIKHPSFTRRNKKSIPKDFALQVYALTRN